MTEAESAFSTVDDLPTAPRPRRRRGQASTWREGKDWAKVQKGIRVPRWLADKLRSHAVRSGRYETDLYTEALRRYVEDLENEHGEIPYVPSPSDPGAEPSLR